MIFGLARKQRKKNENKSSLRKSKTVKIELEIPEGCDAVYTVPLLLYNLKMLGDNGASREINIDDWEYGQNKFGFDGDGIDKIYSLKVNGEEFKPRSKE
jgi:hypothetical protein